MNTQQKETDKLDDKTLAGLDAYSTEGQYIGTVSGYLPLEPEDEEAFERGLFDTIDEDGRLEHTRRVVIDGIGTSIQKRLAIPIDQLKVDLHGRRVTVPLTVAEIESLPQSV